MDHHGRFVPYRRSLRRRAQSLRRDPTAPERKLWFELLRDLPAKFTRQKPLGRYVADFYCASRKRRSADLELQGVRVLRFTNAEIMEKFEGVCGQILKALA